MPMKSSRAPPSPRIYQKSKFVILKAFPHYVWIFPTTKNLHFYLEIAILVFTFIFFLWKGNFQPAKSFPWVDGLKPIL